MTTPKGAQQPDSSGSHAAHDHTPHRAADQADDHTYDAERHLSGTGHNPLPALDHVGDPDAAISEDAFEEVQASAEFAELKRRFRRFAFPMTAAFLIWYFAYVLLSVYAKGFMSQNIGLGNLNLGHVLGLLQFVTTFLITWLYIRHMNKDIDPIANDLRVRLEEMSK